LKVEHLDLTNLEIQKKTEAYLHCGIVRVFVWIIIKSTTGMIVHLPLVIADFREKFVRNFINNGYKSKRIVDIKTVCCNI